VFAGLKQSVTLAVIGATIAEWVVATEGLGYLILVGSENVQLDVMLASLAVLVGIGLVLYGLVVVLQRWVARRVPLD
jgi:NitT/TauT family transport system permease protein